ncbi:MAG: fructose,6-bisphosphatase [Clostridiales bacterium]|nr:fructose,6-bisphosphatase [Clostridiales bacterium]
MEKRYLERLAKEYPTIEACVCEIINLEAIQCLPKGTEYFFSDLHGEYENFSHLLRSASGVIKTKIDDLFGDIILPFEREQLAELIYYPGRVLSAMTLSGSSLESWQKVTIYRLIQVCKKCSSKYTRSKVRKKMPPEYAYILDELLHADKDINKEVYYQSIIESIANLGNADRFIEAICNLIQSLCIDRLHIIGDIYDRGSRPDRILRELSTFPDVDIQWGNHDISWMGAACGNRALIANVIRMAIHYNTFDLIEDGYGISLRSLATFADDVYHDDPCDLFYPVVWDENKYAPISLPLAAKMHKAITIIQFKLEGQLINKHPEYEMDERNLLTRIDYLNQLVEVDKTLYPLRDTYFPTIDVSSPLDLTQEEDALMNVLEIAFLHSSALHKHIKYLYSHGSIYKCFNNNLLFHACIPSNPDGTFSSIAIEGNVYQGKALLDQMEEFVKAAYFSPPKAAFHQNAVDFMWYLWCGPNSPLFGKSKLSCFEQYFLESPSARKETFNPYYSLSNQETFCEKILIEFGLSPTHAHIVNGHVPVRLKEGESPIRANGRLFLIDGGISKAYQSKTGIAGYTLIYNSRTLNLAEHHTYSPENETELYKRTPKVSIIEVMKPRVTVGHTDIGKELQHQILELKELILAFQGGLIKETLPGR